MKKITSIFILIVGILAMNACQKAETDPKLDMTMAVSPTISQPTNGASFVLLEADEMEDITFSWTKASYFPDNLALPSYSVEFVYPDPENEGNTLKKEWISTTETSFTTTVLELNAGLLKLGFVPEQATEVIMTVRSVLKSYDDGKSIAGTELVNGSVTVSFTTYNTSGPIEYAKLWVPGDYQGWAPDKAPNVYSVEDDGVYSGYVYFPAESASFQFKFASQPNWDGPNYGAGATAGTLDTDAGAGNLEVAGAGTYYLVCNTNDLTWTNELRDFALVGTMTSWGDQPDLPLTWNAENSSWTITLSFDAGAEFKWRANSSWDFNYGLNDPDNNLLVKDGANVVVANAGSYTVNLFLYEAFPRYELIAN